MKFAARSRLVYNGRVMTIKQGELKRLVISAPAEHQWPDGKSPRCEPLKSIRDGREGGGVKARFRIHPEASKQCRWSDIELSVIGLAR